MYCQSASSKPPLNCSSCCLYLPGSTHSCPFSATGNCEIIIIIIIIIPPKLHFFFFFFLNTGNMQLRPSKGKKKKKRDSYRQCFSTRRLRAIFSPTSVHTGLVRTILARSALTALTRPPVDSEPMFTISTSFLDSFWTCRHTQR